MSVFFINLTNGRKCNCLTIFEMMAAGNESDIKAISFIHRINISVEHLPFFTDSTWP